MSTSKNPNPPQFIAANNEILVEHSPNLNSKQISDSCTCNCGPRVVGRRIQRSKPKRNKVRISGNTSNAHVLQTEGMLFYPLQLIKNSQDTDHSEHYVPIKPICLVPIDQPKLNGKDEIVFHGRIVFEAQAGSEAHNSSDLNQDNNIQPTINSLLKGKGRAN
ncbi:hypothetical protein O181_022115 [Austropuccinia psidii MF-1]|uniref:Uncharacterized protein n=1 Tax=Austropuccinia psidii MF-1 TaxID=1389203 RepID=A0A9Q3CGU3_9BASI|nr:hypothetical protein [Austropuccinia psidii MF-1]